MNRPAREVHIGSGCVPNISRFGRRIRYAGASLALVAGLAGAAQVIANRQAVAELLLSALSVLAAAFLFFQAREKT